MLFAIMFITPLCLTFVRLSNKGRPDLMLPLAMPLTWAIFFGLGTLMVLIILQTAYMLQRIRKLDHGNK